MAYIIHKTLRKPCNVLNVLPGRWYPKIEGTQYLLNNHTYFDLYRLIHTSSGMKFVKFYQQLFMSKVYSVCSGPTENETSTFYALRDYDIIHLMYSSTEGIFTRQIRLALPPLLSFSSYIYYSDQLLFISSTHGSIGAIDTSPKKEPPIFFDQRIPVLSHFPLSNKGFVGRIEGGPKVTIFDKNPFKIRKQKPFYGKFISHAFEFENDYLAICTHGKILIVDIDDDTGNQEEIILPLSSQPEPEEINDYIIDSSCLSSNSYILFSSFGKAFLLQNRNISLVLREPSVSRIFALTDELVLFTERGNDHIIRNVIKKQNISKIRSCVGQMNLHIGPQAFYLAPHTFTTSNEQLLIGKQGISVLSLSHHDCKESIYGLFSFSAHHKNYIVVSFQDSSRLLEVVDKEIKRPDTMLIKECVRTLGICSISSTNGNILFQATPDGLSLYNPAKGSCDYYLNTFASFSSHVVHYVSNSRQIFLFLSSKTVYMIQCQLTNGNSNVEKMALNSNLNVTTMALSKPDSTGLSEYIAYGIFDSSIPTVELHTVSTDQASREKVIVEKMPSKVASIKIVNCLVNGSDVMKIVIGLEEGTIVVGHIDLMQRVIDKVSTIQFGSGPCILTRIFTKYDHPILLAMNSRPMIINMVHGLPRFCPLSINSVGHATSIGDMNLFLLASGNIISVSALYDIDNFNSENETTMSFSRYKFPSKIVSIMPIPNERFSIVALTKSVTLFDSCKLLSTSKDLATFPDETVRAASLSTVKKADRNSSFLCVGTTKSEGQSLVRLYMITVSQQNVQIKPPVIGEVKGEITSVCVGANLNVFVGCGDTIFCYKIHEDALQNVARMSGVGINIRHMCFVPQTDKQSKGGIYVGDSFKSVKLVRFSENTKQFKLKAEEGITRNVTALSRFESKFVAGGDAVGNVFVLEYPQIPLTADSVLDKAVFSARRRLSLKFNYFVGDSVTGVQHTANLFSCLWYSTVSGGFGGFLSLVTDQNGAPMYDKYWTSDFIAQAKMLKRLELEVSQKFLNLCGGDHISFRNKFFPSSNVIDLDMVEMYLLFSEDVRNEIAKNIQMSSKSAISPNDIEFEINRFRKYFIDWHSKT